MKTYLLAASLIFALTGPVLAQSGFYIVLDKATGKCSMATTPPTESEKFSMMGQYGSEAAAKQAMSKMKECK